MSLHDDQPLDGYEQGALARSLATPEAEDWWAGLPPKTRRAIMNKLIAALAKAESPRDIGTLSRSLMKADELDLKRKQGPREGDKHLHIHGGLANMNADELRNYIAARLGSSPDAAERD